MVAHVNQRVDKIRQTVGKVYGLKLATIVEGLKINTGRSNQFLSFIQFSKNTKYLGEVVKSNGYL